MQYDWEYKLPQFGEAILRYCYHDGGRKAAGYIGTAGDCVTRAIAIAARIDYQEVYDSLSYLNHENGEARSARNGIKVQDQWFKDYMKRLGFVWVPTMARGTGCRVHLRADELPMGRLVCRVSRHMCAVIDRVLYDSHDCSRNGTRCVYGYWILK